ncbi:NPCBM/NEW2 domain-containing protein [Parasalinivibrio latis]|uniref:NPCBM/NEW2 domain-containing protein n=1 Tax=Parasalinivibrio latis TaxID=2952610 RepID=UPI0030E27243
MNRIYEPDLFTADRSSDRLRTIDFSEVHSYGLSGDSLVAIHNVRGIEIWDWSDIFNPVQVSKLALDDIVQAGYGNIPWHVSWQAPYLYVARGTSGISIVDTTDITNPVHVKTIPTSQLGGFLVGKVRAFGNKLHISSRNNRGGFSILNIDDPLNPVLEKTVPNLPFVYYTSCWDGKYSYFGARAASDSLIVYDTTTTPMSLVSDKVTGFLNTYCSHQDEKLIMGNRFDVGTLDVADKSNIREIGRGVLQLDPSITPDHGQSYPFGNLIWVGNDHGSGSGFMAHEAQPDTNPPSVFYTYPEQDSTRVPVTARVGLAMSDSILLESVNNQTFVVKEFPGGQQLSGTYSVNRAFVHFSPDQPLKQNSIYQVIASGIKDFSGNPMPEYRFNFATGTVSGHDVSLTQSTMVEVAQPLVLNASAQPILGGTVEYSWDFGDGTPSTPFSTNGQVQHTYASPGHWQPIVTIRENQLTSTDSLAVTAITPVTPTQPTTASSIISTGNRIYTANEDNGSVTAFSAYAPFNKIWESPVGKKPRTLARAPDGRIWVVNQGSDSISILNPTNGLIVQTVSLPRASQPYGVVFSPDESHAFVTLQSSGRLLKMDPLSGSILQSRNVGHSARGVAVDSNSDTVFVTRFKSPQDHARVIAVDIDLFSSQVIRLGKDTITVDGPDRSRGLPNYLNSITISPDGNWAWVPANKVNVDRGPFNENDPDSKLTFDSTVRAILSPINLQTRREAFNKQIDFDNASQPKAAVFSRAGDYIYTALEGSNRIEVRDAYNNNIALQLNRTGDAPIGLVRSGKFLFVHGFLSRSVKVFDVSAFEQPDKGEVVEVANLKTVETEKMNAAVLAGKRIFHNAEDARMATDGYLSCASCHADGDSDGRVWDFTDRGEGLRNTLSLLGRSGTGNGNVHWTANFDEIQDFENDIRHGFGGRGFLPDQIFENTENPLGSPKSGLSSELDNLALYVSSLSEYPGSYKRRQDGSLGAYARRGKALFESKGCNSCHSGPAFTDMKRHDVGTIQPSSGLGIGQSLSGKGFKTPTLIGLMDSAPYFHNGQAATLNAVLQTGGVHYISDSAERLDVESYLQQIEYEGNPLPESTGSEFIFVSDITPVTSSNGYGPVEFDQSVGGTGSNDGRPLTIDGQTFTKGIGAHAASEVTYDLTDLYVDQFSSYIGLDDGAGNGGSAVYEVHLDGQRVYVSPVLRGSDNLLHITIPISPLHAQLKLVTLPTSDGKAFDHTNWGDAKLRIQRHVYLSDLPEVSSTNGWGPVEKDQSVGQKQANDGGIITINGTQYSKGLGTHSTSEITYDLAGKYYSAFSAVIGVDDSAGNRGSVVFEVYVDSKLVYQSPVMTGRDDGTPVNIPLTDVNTELTLKVLPTSDGGSYDHADWADAKLRQKPYVYASDMQEISSTNGWGPIEKDQNVGQKQQGDGSQIRIANVGYEKGLGTHSVSSITYNIDGLSFRYFEAVIGIDDSAGNQGSVVFNVVVDGTRLYRSQVLRGTHQGVPISVPLSSDSRQVVLEVENAQDGGGFDHADWANARFVR